MIRKLNISKLSMGACFTLWFVYLSNIAVLSSGLVLLFSLLFLLIALLNVARPRLFSRLLKQSLSAKLIYACFFLIVTQYFFLEFFIGDISANLNVILRGYIGLFFIFITTANFNYASNGYKNLRILLFISTLTVFCSVGVQFLNPELWNSIADTSDRVVSDAGQTGRAFGLMFNALDLVFFCGVFLVGSVIVDGKDGSSSIGIITRVMLILMLILCFARSSYIIVFLMFCMNPMGNIKYGLLLAPIIFVLYRNDLLYGDGFDRLSFLLGSASEFTTGGSTRNRSEIIQTVIDNADKVPFFGLGLSGRDQVLPSYWRAHNFLLESFMTVGYFGLLLLGIIWSAIAIIVFGSRLKWSSKIVIFLVPLVSLMTVGHVTWSFTLYFYFFLVLILEQKKVQNAKL
jgi:hypothetical protein